MKKFILPIALITTLFTSCTISTGTGDGNNEVLVAEGDVVTKERQLEGDFNRLSLDGVFGIEVTQGDENKVRIEAQENIHKVIDTTVKDNELTIGYAEGKTIKKVKNFKIFVTVKELNHIKFDGVGALKFKDIDTDSLTVKANSVGVIELAGKVDYADLRNNGVGGFDANELKAKKAKVVNNGVGGLSIYVTDSLKATNNGVGGVSYYGKPKVVKTSRNGLGGIKDEGMR